MTHGGGGGAGGGGAESGVSSSSASSSPSLGPPRSFGTTHMTHRSSDASVAAAARSSSAPRGSLGRARDESFGRAQLCRRPWRRAGWATRRAANRRRSRRRRRRRLRRRRPRRSMGRCGARSSRVRRPVEAQVENFEPAGRGVEGGCARVRPAGGGRGGAPLRRRRGSRSGSPAAAAAARGSTRSMARSPEDGEGGAVGSREGSRRAGREGRPLERAPRSARRSSDAETRRVTATVLRRGIRARGGGASRSVISAPRRVNPRRADCSSSRGNNDQKSSQRAGASFFEPQCRWARR